MSGLGGLLQGGLVQGGGAWSRGVPGPGGAWSRGSTPEGSGLGGAWWKPPDGYCCGQYASYWNAFLFNAELHNPGAYINECSICVRPSCALVSIRMLHWVREAKKHEIKMG